MDEHVLSIVLGEEAKALLRVEPLHLAGRHRYSLLVARS
jgi:hypothetical protein